jgi:hypothetical protein
MMSVSYHLTVQSNFESLHLPVYPGNLRSPEKTQVTSAMQERIVMWGSLMALRRTRSRRLSSARNVTQVRVIDGGSAGFSLAARLDERIAS